MHQMERKSTARSAPGKVLFAGGFLVLDREHTGLVLGLNARIHIRVDPLESSHSEDDLQVDVSSPQFLEARWRYKFERSTKDRCYAATQIQPSAVHTSTPNKFVATSLEYGLTYLAHCVGVSLGDFKVTILADNDYYSQTSASTRTGFATFSTTIQDTHKTGLGSSAALVTALVATLLGFFSPISYRQDIKVIHNLAQAAHCAAQGKVGSGFDVAAAVYGSCLYRRFSPSILESLGESSTAGFGARLHRCVEDRDEAHPWDVEISDTAVDIPESLLVRMCDVDCGSETPSMVRKVLTWRKENPLECQLLWAALQRAQDDLIRELKRLSAHSGLRMEDQDLLHDIIKTMRSLVREMTEKSSVPIEPPAITELLNYCTSLPGVIGGVAPGAGGYDAIALLIRNDVEVLRDLNNRLEHWTQSSPNDIVTVGRARLLSAHQAYEGLQVEDPSRYDDWVR